ncbi:hypothetical protein ACFW04_011821 [Cataglyphis niger]
MLSKISTCKRDVKDWCKSCKICISKKGPIEKGKSPMQIYNVGNPFQRVQMDIFGPLPIISSGNKYLIVIVDCFIKWVEAFSLKSIRAKTMAQIFNQKDWDQWIPMFLLTYRSSRYETTESLPIGNFVKTLREKLEEIHSKLRERMNIKSSQVKSWHHRNTEKTFI